MAEKPLYEDKNFKIIYSNHAPEEHIIYISGKKPSSGYYLPSGILRELAQTKRGGIESKINAFNEGMLYGLKQEGISIDGLHVALCQAYAEEESRMNDWIKKQKK